MVGKPWCAVTWALGRLRLDAGGGVYPRALREEVCNLSRHNGHQYLEFCSLPSVVSSSLLVAYCCSSLLRKVTPFEHAAQHFGQGAPAGRWDAARQSAAQRPLPSTLCIKINVFPVQKSLDTTLPIG